MFRFCGGGEMRVARGRIGITLSFLTVDITATAFTLWTNVSITTGLNISIPSRLWNSTCHSAAMIVSVELKIT